MVECVDLGNQTADGLGPAGVPGGVVHAGAGVEAV